MRFDGSQRRRPGENLVPMINVVFLLLIFFLMTAQIAPPEPFAVTPPVSAAEDPAQGDFTLHLDAEGRLGFRDHLGEAAALAALAGALESGCVAGGCPDDAPPVVILRADGNLPAARLAQLMPRIGAAGAAQVQLVTVPQ